MIAVVAGLIVRSGRLMIARRPEGKHMAGKWEFPGGKLEKGELPEDALVRELGEELAVETRALGILAAIPYSYPEKDVLLLFYAAALTDGEPVPVEEAEVRWVTKAELDGFDFAPVDRLMVERLKNGGFEKLLTFEA